MPAAPARRFAEQMELQLFAPPTFADIIRNRGIPNLVVRCNARMRRSWRVAVSALSGMRTLTVPQHLESAPEPVKGALVEWALIAPLRRRKKNAAALKGKRMLEHAVFEYIESSGNGARRARTFSPGSLQSAGRIYDLREVFDSLNARYFNGRLGAFVRWNKSRRRSYQTTFVDSSGNSRNLISIARAYNAANVPRFAVEGVMFHEMLHIVHPPYKRDFRTIIHGQEFRRAERAFPHFKEWRAWEKREMRSRAE